MAFRIEFKPNEDPNPTECPITLTTIQNACVLPNCGHVFEMENVKTLSVCALCQTPIEPLSLKISTDVTNMVTYMTKQDAEILALKAQVAEQQALIKALNVQDAKALGEVPITLQTKLMRTTQIQQQIADAEYIQKITYAQKIVREHLINNRIPYLIRKHVQIKTTKKDREIAHQETQEEIKLKLKELDSQLNPAHLLDEKRNHITDTYNAMRQKILEGKQENQTFQKKMNSLRMRYVDYVRPELGNTFGLFQRWIKTNRKIEQQAEELESLRQTGEESLKQATSLIHQQTTNTLRLFGGKKGQRHYLRCASEKEYKLLKQAVDTGDLPLTTKLLKTNRFDFQSRRFDESFTYLGWAIYKCHIFIMELLIDAGENINARFYNKKKKNKVPLLSGIITYEHIQQEMKIIMLKMLLDKGANINQQDELGFTPLHVAAYFHQKATIKLLRRYFPNPNITDINRHTPLQTALSCQQANKAPKTADINSINKLLAQIEEQGKNSALQQSAIDLPPGAAPQVEYKKLR